ncbi:breast carcinoma amplified sequence 2-domain-containing protein [Xylariaceae sp. FL1019]|nr:breast carcinoma amplified sequence 2-domain-containing protein [Xylariaceae sp. FL1019]
MTVTVTVFSGYNHLEAPRRALSSENDSDKNFEGDPVATTIAIDSTPKNLAISTSLSTKLFNTTTNRPNINSRNKLLPIELLRDPYTKSNSIKARHGIINPHNRARISTLYVPPDAPNHTIQAFSLTNPPDIDAEPSESEREAAQSLITAELSSSDPSTSPDHQTTPHPTLPPLYTPNFTPLMSLELSRIASKTPLNAIDQTRYEVQDTPSPNTPLTPTTLTPPLSLAYTTATYLSTRQIHLDLLSQYGRNAWLVSNWQTESLLASLERDLAATKKEIDILNLQRQRVQSENADELRSLEETWKKGVGRVLETEAATEALRQQVLERQRAGA